MDIFFFGDVSDFFFLSRGDYETVAFSVVQPVKTDYSQFASLSWFYNTLLQHDWLKVSNL